MPRPLAVLLTGLLATAPAAAAPRAHAVAKMTGLDGKALGTVRFSAVNRGVLIEFDLSGLPPGAHGVHLHVSGNCDARTGFTSAGPILSLTPGKSHGYLSASGPIAGDLPNQVAAADGRLRAGVFATGFNLGNGKRTIFDRDGVALILTQRADDYRTQPLGNGGARIACGVVVRTAGPAPRRPDLKSQPAAAKKPAPTRAPGR